MNISRNAPCPCGSGKKYKKCCKNNDEMYELLETIEEGFSSITEEELMLQFANNMHHFLLEKEPHIKKYKRLRRLHGEIIDSMLNELQTGKFQLEVTG